MFKFSITKEVLGSVYEHALKENPFECCGWIIQDSSGKQIYYPAENLQNRYHKIDPKLYPRTAEHAFMMNTLYLSQALEKAESENTSMFCITHSHVNCGAYFSDEDKKQMSNDDNTDQLYPASCYLVVSIQNNQPVEEAMFYYDKNKQNFIEAQLQII